MPVRIGAGVRLGIGLGIQAGGGSTPFVGPYDAIPNIAAAYGMRRLLSAYTGSLLRLRRSSDNAEQNIGYLANGDLDTAAIATFIGGGSGFVATWYDQKGSTNATQTTASKQPGYVSQSSGMSFDGSDDFLDTGITPGTSGTYSLLVRFLSADLTKNNGLISAGLSGGGFQRTGIRLSYSVSNVLAYAQNGGLASGAAAEAAAGVAALAGTKAYFNGTDEGITLSPAGANINLSFYIGAEDFGGGAATAMTGNVREVIISASTYSAGQVASITTIMG